MGERVGERVFVLSVHNKTILWQNMEIMCHFLSYCLLYLFAWSVSLFFFILFFAVVGGKDL